ncbi:MAG: transposase [Polaribacter sp.]|jgi:transposase
MDTADILPRFKGTLCHDHWKPYYRYKNCQHALCNAYHLRELTRASEQDHQKWAGKMKIFLEIANRAVHKAGGVLSGSKLQLYKRRYKRLLEKGKKECPPPVENKKIKRGRLKRSKSRNLLERLINFEDDVLRFMENKEIPFTNNQGEKDIRMTKVQQKISGCFRSKSGADVFCRVRGYLSTCRKQNVSSSEALKLLFKG